MQALTTQELAQACQIFLELAYPGGPDTIPAPKRPYLAIAADRPLEDFLCPSALAAGICQSLAQSKGALRGWEFRLGSASHAHLKLRIQIITFRQQDVWVYSVDTHDGFHQATKYLSDPEIEAWRTLVENNRDLKQQIEDALALAGFVTPKVLLQLDLPTPLKP